MWKFVEFDTPGENHAVLICGLTACKRLSHDCAYDEVRKKSGPKRGYVKLLEARLRMSIPIHVVDFLCAFELLENPWSSILIKCVSQ
jgi:hypothetical protein